MNTHFDNPLVEQRELIAGSRVVVMTEKAVIKVTGDDRLTWLNAMLSQNVANLSAGQSAEGLLLDAQGRIEHDVQVIEDGQATWLIISAEHQEKLLKWLDMMIFRSKVKVEPAIFNVVGSFGGGLSGLVWQDNWTKDPIGSVRYASNLGEAWDYCESLVTDEELAGILAETKQAGRLALEALRVAAHRPWQPNELDDKTLPHELDWLSSAVHLSKGCYRGQESVAKVHNLGHPPRRLVLLHLDGSGHELASAGDQVFVSGTDNAIGRITSIGQHYELGPIALAVIGRNVDEKASLFVRTEFGEIAAKQETIVPPTAGMAANLAEKRKNLLGR
ncbi:MAG: YgfZ/GcvT domain-containing protein [Micrococcales bacterium]